MSTYESLSHSKWDCKYHIVFVPKGRKKNQAKVASRSWDSSRFDRNTPPNVRLKR